MKVYSWIILVILVALGCSSENIQSDIYVKPDYSFSKVKKIAIGSLEVRTNVPYAKLNFQEQLEYHLLRDKYSVVPSDKIMEYFKSKKKSFGKSLTTKEITELQSKNSFDLFIQGVLYEENKFLIDEDNYIILSLNLYNPTGEKVSTIRYIYSGERSLISGELIDESIKQLLGELAQYRK